MGDRQKQPAVAEPDMGHLNLDWYPGKLDPFMAPVELKGLARGKERWSPKFGQV